MRASSTLTSRGQVTIPKDVRAQLGLRPGDQLEFVKDDSGFRVQKLVVTSPFDRYVGYLGELAGQDPDALVDEMRGS